MGTQSILLLVGMVSRAIFVNTLGEEYLGISGLFSSTIAVLSLTNLGLGDAIVYLLIRYFAENNIKKIKLIFGYAKKIYYVLIAVILTVGLLGTPIVLKIVNVDSNDPYIAVYYWMFVFNTALSYFCAPLNTVFRADQRMRVVTKGQFWATIIVTSSQIVMLCVGGNYAAYLCLMLMTNVINYVFFVHIAKKHYPYLMGRTDNVVLSNADKQEIVSSVKNTFVHKITWTIMGSIDNITISTFLGTALVGIYSNYNVVIDALKTVVKIVYRSIFSSVGNVNINSDNSFKERIFKIETFVFHCLSGLATTGIYVLMQDLVTMWLGREYLLDKSIVIFVCIDFYIAMIIYSQENFIQTSEWFKKTKFVTFSMSICNLILSIILGSRYGLEGIILATILSRILILYVVRTPLVYEKLFGGSLGLYYKTVIGNALVAIGQAIVIDLILKPINGTIWYWFIIKFILVIVLVVMITILIYWHTQEFKFLLNQANQIGMKFLAKWGLKRN